LTCTFASACQPSSDDTQITSDVIQNGIQKSNPASPFGTDSDEPNTVSTPTEIQCSYDQSPLKRKNMSKSAFSTGSPVPGLASRYFYSGN
jgi:hypothetical protein